MSPAISVNRTLIIFSRYPAPGKVKTRLIPLLGSYGAARLQRDMACLIIKNLRLLAPDVSIEIHYESDDIAVMKKMFGKDLKYSQQVSGDIGQRMHTAFSKAFDNGNEQVVLIGTDCPFMTPETIRQAFLKLETNDCVFGPAHDGGYYLIGLKKLSSELFKDISWGSSLVLDQSLAKTKSLGLSTVMLGKLHDIDRREDVMLWQNFISENHLTLSVIIPTLNEDRTIIKTLNSLNKGKNIEIIIVDGGSADNTVELTQASGACVIRAPVGRACQMNIGAAHAAGDYLLFLHADTSLPMGYDDDIRKALSDPQIIAGAFRLKFDSDKLSMRIIEFGANLRSRYFSLPYGDQGLFINKADFVEAGGFPELPIMDDVVFVKALKKKGLIITLDKDALTSARRYERLGSFRTWLINQCVIICYLCGVGPETLLKMYRNGAGLAKWLRLVCKILLERTWKNETN